MNNKEKYFLFKQAVDWPTIWEHGPGSEGSSGAVGSQGMAGPSSSPPPQAIPPAEPVIPPTTTPSPQPPGLQPDPEPSMDGSKTSPGMDNLQGEVLLNEMDVDNNKNKTNQAGIPEKKSV